MKKNLIYAGMLLLGMAVATSCTNEESLDQVLSNGTTIQAVIENATEARTSVSDNYEVLWTTGDQFDVWNGETKAGVLELKSGDGATSGTFGLPTGAEAFGVEDGMTAFFPSNTSGENAYTFATSYTSQETDAPMLGTFADGKFTFSLLSAMVRVVVTDVPEGTAKLTISSNSVNFTGEAALSNGALGLATNGGKEVTVTITNNAESTLTFDVPVPAQEYTNGLSVKLEVGNTEVFNKTTNEFTAVAGKIYVFGAKTVSVDTTEDLTSTIQELLEGGYAVVLDGQAEEVAVSSLSVPENITATLDLNGKKLILGEASTMSLNRSASSEYGITNNGTLTITNGTITASEEFVAAIYNAGTLEITESTIEAVNRGIINCGTAALDCNVTSEKSNAVCGYGDATNVITINGGIYTASKTTEKASALRMDPRSGGVISGSAVDKPWQLTINGGTFISEKWVALEMLDNYYNLGEAGWAKINGGTFTGNKDHADIGGVAVQNITISSECTLTNGIIKNQTSSATIGYDCIMNGYNLQDKNNHYNEVFISGVFTNGGEFTLAGNASFAETLTVANGKEVTLNLGAYTLTSTDDYAAFINNGTLNLNSGTEGGVAASYRGVINKGTANLNCNITSENSNAVCGYGENNVITVTGGIYTASKTTPKTSALRMDPREDGETTGTQVDSAWQLTIDGGKFVSEEWVALEMLNNYSGLGENAGWAKINAGTFEGNANHADIGGVAVENITINTDVCVLDIIKNQTSSGNYTKYSCKMNGYNIQDGDNHYEDVKEAYDNNNN